MPARHITLAVAAAAVIIGRGAANAAEREAQTARPSVAAVAADVPATVPVVPVAVEPDAIAPPVEQTFTPAPDEVDPAATEVAEDVADPTVVPPTPVTPDPYVDACMYEDQAPWVSPQGQPLVSFDGTVGATYADGWVYDCEGWHPGEWAPIDFDQAMGLCAVASYFPDMSIVEVFIYQPEGSETWSLAASADPTIDGTVLACNGKGNLALESNVSERGTTEAPTTEDPPPTTPAEPSETTPADPTPAPTTEPTPAEPSPSASAAPTTTPELDPTEPTTAPSSDPAPTTDEAPAESTKEA